MMTPLYTKSHSNFAAWCKGVRGERCNAGVDQHRFAWSGWYEYKTRTRKDENGLTKREAAKYKRNAIFFSQNCFFRKCRQNEELSLANDGF